MDKLNVWSVVKTIHAENRKIRNILSGNILEQDIRR